MKPCSMHTELQAHQVHDSLQSSVAEGPAFYQARNQLHPQFWGQLLNLCEDAEG